MLRHARPHLEIHSRSKGHSAVAGVAYRLGLRLWDERQQCWHDYTRRALGEEVVMAMTVAPAGSPEWATDPGQLWNAVEASEKRRDSQVARDYRIPVPLGLDDQRAGQLAERLARFIMSELGTPVSVGLHRDADTDALGQVKPPGKQGYHAHLYFPSRPLVIQATGDGEDTGETVAVFGARHPMLASKALGRSMVELFNKTWAELSTEAAAAAGMDARYEYRSYERLGLDLAPQPTMGAGATALERKGFWTRKGDAVRDIVVASRAYEIAHSEAIATQEDAARADVAREGAAWNGAGAEADRPSVPDTEQGPPTHEVPGTRPTEMIHPDEVLAGLAPDAPLAIRFQALAPRPNGPEEAARLGRLTRLVRALQRAMALLRGLAERLAETEHRAGRARAAKLEARYELDQARRARAKASGKAEAWAVAHPLRMRTARLAGRRPRAWRELSHDVTFWQRAVAHVKAVVAAQTGTADEATADAERVGQRHRRTVGRMETAIHTFTREGPDMVPPLLAAMNEEERQVVEPMLASASFEGANVLPMVEPVLTYRPPGMRPRP